MSPGAARRPGAADLERIRVALALCLSVEREDGQGFEVLRSSLPDEALVKGLVNVVRSLATGVCRITGEEPKDLFRRLIDDVLVKEMARWW